jgi:protein-tyrosine phosphatase
MRCRGSPARADLKGTVTLIRVMRQSEQVLRRRARARGPTEPCDLLVVCTGNICRSPMAAAMLAAGLPHLSVASAGTSALEGRPPHENTLTVLATEGVPALDHRARQLTPAIAQSAGLIVTMTRQHRSIVISDMGVEAFTVHELARLIKRGDPGTPAELSTLLSARRGAEQRDFDEPDVTDPIGLPLVAYEQCFEALTTGLRSLAAVLDA